MRLGIVVVAIVMVHSSCAVSWCGDHNIIIRYLLVVVPLLEMEIFL